MDDKKTCWYDTKTTPEMMKKAAKGAFWPVLADSDHWPVLNKLIQKTELPPGSLLADVGCGMGELRELVIPRFMYSGFDLSHIIEAARDHNPKGYFEAFDIYQDDCPFNFYNLIICNAFIDVLTKPFEALEKILQCHAEYVIIHRQTITQKPTYFTEHESYGGMSYQSILNGQELAECIANNGYDVIEKLVVYNREEPHVSFLLAEA